jgi:NAD(P)-dependent dehydrogenase (short-subunit alcohol dehydrogenase family)
VTDDVEQSKTADNALTVFYGNTLGKNGFTVTSICPGYCDTNLTAHQGFKDPKDGAEAILIALREKREDVHLKFVHNDGGNGRYPW